MLIASISLQSCAKSEEDKVLDKINKKEQLTKSDYDVMMEYVLAKIDQMVEIGKSNDKSRGEKYAIDLKNDKYVEPFLAKLPKNFSDEVTMNRFLGIDVVLSDYYPKGMKIEGADKLLQDMSFEKTPQNLWLACTIDGKDFFISPQQWNSMSMDQKNLVLRRGLIIMQDGELFLLEGKDAPGGVYGDFEKQPRGFVAHLPSKHHAEILVGNLDKIQNSLKTFGFQPLKGEYLTRQQVKSEDFKPLKYHFNTDGEVFPAEYYKAALARSIGHIYETTPEGFTLSNLEGDAEYSMELRKGDEVFYIPVERFYQLPSDTRVEYWGVRVKKDDVDRVFDIQKLKDRDGLVWYETAKSKYNDFIPSPEFADFILANLDDIDAAIISMGGYPLGEGREKEYFMQMDHYPFDPLTFGKPKQLFIGNKIVFKPLQGEGNVRANWAPKK